MQAFQESFSQAFRLLFQADSTLLEIVVLSLNVSFSATFLACLFGMPFGALLATREFPGKWVLTVIINTLMGMPPVVLGLLVYMLLSGSGPFGWMQLLYTPRAMIIVHLASNGPGGLRVSGPLCILSPSSVSVFCLLVVRCIV